MTKTQKNDWYVTKIKMLFMEGKYWTMAMFRTSWRFQVEKMQNCHTWCYTVTYFTVFCTTLIHISCSSAA